MLAQCLEPLKRVLPSEQALTIQRIRNPPSWLKCSSTREWTAMVCLCVCEFVVVKQKILCCIICRREKHVCWQCYGSASRILRNFLPVGIWCLWLKTLLSRCVVLAVGFNSAMKPASSHWIELGTKSYRDSSVIGFREKQIWLIRILPEDT